MEAFNWIYALVLFMCLRTGTCQGSLDTGESKSEESEQKTSIELQESYWSEWTDWSPCSRTCDGGTAFQLRRCSRLFGCSGNIVRYRLCNMQPCPDPVDFRDYQCASFNDIPYNSQLMKWTTYQGEQDEPCELKCQSDSGVVATLAPTVKDGTRCRPGSLDLCVDGICQSVGCDLMIGSDARVDACGVCGGDGSSCTQPLYHWIVEPASFCSATCGTGYKMSQVVCRNVVTGADVKPQLCDESLKPVVEVIKCNLHPCPAKWVAESWNRCSKTCGGGIRQRTVVCVQLINSTLTKVSESNCKGARLRTTEPCNNIRCPPFWKVGHWSECSVTCGDGIQLRNVTCVSSENGRENYNTTCDESKKPDKIQQCSTETPCDSYPSLEVPDLDETMRILHPYPPFHPVAEKLIGEQVVKSSLSSSEPSYKPDPWSECSVTCGEGIRKREVPCTVFLETVQIFAKLPDQHCQGKKPPTTERCVQQPCSLENRMDTVEDSYSDATYSDPYRAQYSETAIKVAPQRTGKNYVWITQGYTHCSASCLGGDQETIIMCVREDDQKVVSPYLCSPETRPESHMRTCNMDACPPRWNHSEFQPCSKPCGIGIQTREVHCIHQVISGSEGTQIVPNHKCPQPPPIDRQYCNVLDCPVAWHTSEWSKCSKRCGGGIKTRLVECKQVMAQNHIVPRPISLCPKNRPPERRPCNTKPCPSEDQRPSIISDSEVYIQPVSKRKISLKIGGNAQVYHGTLVKIKCPVKKFDRTKIQWAKDHKLISSSKKYKISKKGALRIQNVNYGDNGVFTCIAGRSSADITITVKQRPGDVFLSSEEIEKHSSNQLDPAMHSNGEPPQRPFIMPGDDESHEQRPVVGDIQPPRRFRPTLPSHRDKLNNMWPQQHSHSTTTSLSDQAEFGFTTEEPISFEPPSSGGSLFVPHFHWLITNLQNFLSNRRNHILPEERDKINTFSLTNSFSESPFQTLNEINKLILKKDEDEDMNFEWLTHEWSPCSKLCHTNNSQVRNVYCIVRYNNFTEVVSNNMCLKANIPKPSTERPCEPEICPHWRTSSWEDCVNSSCFKKDTAIQSRNVTCHAWNGTVLNDSWCTELNKPITRQECYNKMCKGVWKVGLWSECTGMCGKKGVKYRILQCIWQGTYKPAGNACIDTARPNVMKPCKGLPCYKSKDCKNRSKFCSNLQSNYICGHRRYRSECCQSCSNNFH